MSQYAAFIDEMKDAIPAMPLWAVATRLFPRPKPMADGESVQPLVRILVHAPSRRIFLAGLLDPRMPLPQMPDVLMLLGSGGMSPDEVIGFLRERYGWPGPEWAGPEVTA